MTKDDSEPGLHESPSHSRYLPPRLAAERSVPSADPEAEREGEVLPETFDLMRGG